MDLHTLQAEIDNTAKSRRDNDTMVPVAAEDFAWLARQLAAYPERVDEQSTTNQEFLMLSAARTLVAQALEIQSLHNALAAAEEDKPNRVLVALDGGLVQGGCSDRPVEVMVVDYDVEGADEETLADIPQDDGSVEPASVSYWGLDSFSIDPAFIDGALNATQA